MHLGDATVGQQRRVVQRLFRRAQRLERDTHLCTELDPRFRRELGDRGRHERLVVVQQEHLVDVHPDPRRRLARPGGLLGALDVVALGCADDEVGEWDPLMDPAAVRAAEHALGCARVADPTLEVRGLRVLDALPCRERRREHPLHERRRDTLAPAGQFADAQCRADRQRRQVAGGDTHPRHAGEQRAGSGRRDPAVVGDHEVGERGWDTGEARQRAAGDAPALPLMTRAGRDQSVVAGTVGVLAGVAVGRDGAVDEAWVDRVQRVEVDPEPGGGTG